MGLDKNLLSELMRGLENTEPSDVGAPENPEGAQGVQPAVNADGTDPAADIAMEPHSVSEDPESYQPPILRSDRTEEPAPAYAFSEDSPCIAALLRIRGRIDDIEQLLPALSPERDAALAAALDNIAEQLGALAESAAAEPYPAQDAKPDPSPLKPEIPVLDIDRSLSWLEGDRLRLSLSYLPENVDLINYTVSSHESPEGEVSSYERVLSVSADQYRRDGMILIGPVTTDTVYITLFAQCHTPDGEKYFSEPIHLTFGSKRKTKISYRIERITAGGLLGAFRTAGLQLVMHSNTASLPRMKLVYRYDKHIPMSLSDPQTVVLYDIEPQDLVEENGVIKFVFPDEKWRKLPEGTELRLMIFDSNPKDYEIRIEDLRSMRITR